MLPAVKSALTEDYKMQLQLHLAA